MDAEEMRSGSWRLGRRAAPRHRPPCVPVRAGHDAHLKAWTVECWQLQARAPGDLEAGEVEQLMSWQTWRDQR